LEWAGGLATSTIINTPAPTTAALRSQELAVIVYPLFSSLDLASGYYVFDPSRESARVSPMTTTPVKLRCSMLFLFELSIRRNPTFAFSSSIS